MSVRTKDELEALLAEVKQELADINSLPDEPDISPAVVFADVEIPNGKPGRNPVTTYTLYKNTNDLWSMVEESAASASWSDMMAELRNRGDGVKPRIFWADHLQELT